MVNLTNIEIPDSVTAILRLGKGFSSMALNCRSKQVFEIMKDVEANMDKLPRSDQQDFRSKVLHLSKSFIDKFGMHKSSINQKIERGILTRKKFLRDNSDLICVIADKGNITVCMRKSEYISDMEQMLNNPKDFDRLNENPLKKLLIYIYIYIYI